MATSGDADADADARGRRETTVGTVDAIETSTSVTGIATTGAASATVIVSVTGTANATVTATVIGTGVIPTGHDAPLRDALAPPRATSVTATATAPRGSTSTGPRVEILLETAHLPLACRQRPTHTLEDRPLAVALVATVAVVVEREAIGAPTETAQGFPTTTEATATLAAAPRKGGGPATAMIETGATVILPMPTSGVTRATIATEPPICSIPR